MVLAGERPARPRGAGPALAARRGEPGDRSPSARPRRGLRRARRATTAGCAARARRPRAALVDRAARGRLVEPHARFGRAAARAQAARRGGGAGLQRPRLPRARRDCRARRGAAARAARSPTLVAGPLELAAWLRRVTRPRRRGRDRARRARPRVRARPRRERLLRRRRMPVTRGCSRRSTTSRGSPPRSSRRSGAPRGRLRARRRRAVLHRRARRGRDLAARLGHAVGDPGVSHAGDRWPRTGAVGHTGFTGTSLWLDLPRRRWVALLTNRVHPTRFGTTAEAIKALRRAIGDATVAALDG